MVVKSIFYIFVGMKKTGQSLFYTQLTIFGTNQSMPFPKLIL